MSAPQTNAANADPQTRVATAAAHLRAGETDAAAALLEPLLQAYPDQPVILYLAGLVAAERRDWATAEQALRRALATGPARPDIYLNLAHVLRAQFRPAEALAFCRAALAAMPGDADVLLEMAKAQEESGDSHGAETSYRQLRAKGPHDAAAIGLATLLNAVGRHADAENLVRTALGSGAQPHSTQAALALEHQLGVALKTQRRHREALERLDRARALGTSRDVMIERANVLQHLGRFEEAATEYAAWLAQAPEDLPVHTLLNEIYYRHRQDDRFLTSYDIAARQAPSSAALPAAKANFLLKTGHAAEARIAYEQALHLAPSDADALNGMGLALEALQDFDGARRTHERCIALHPGRGEVLEDYAGFLIKQGEPDHAQRLAEQAVRLRPASQGAYALLTLAYRAQQDAREEILNSYDSYVQYVDLTPPDGYAGMAAFNRDLDAYLVSVCPDEREYLTQTVRGGRQVYGEMFYSGHALVDRLLPRILTAVQTYAARLKGPAGHPFVSRRDKGFRFSGSWSSRLGDCGYHVNHIHQKGWISACYYVAVPDVTAGNPDRQGWIKFGEPSTDYGDAFKARRAVEPRPGRLVMFPSYIWHGTVPFHAPQARTTIAFDIVPA